MLADKMVDNMKKDTKKDTLIYTDSGDLSINNLKLMSIIWTIGAFLVSLTYLLLHIDLIFYDKIFWIGIILSGISTYLIVSSDHKTGVKLCFLFLFGFVLYIPHTLSSPNHFHVYDELIHYQTTLLVYETGNIDMNSTSFLISKYYPSLEILAVFFKNMTGDSIFISGLILIGIIHSSTVIFLYLFFRNVCSEKIASIGAFAYFFNSSYTHFDTYFSYESIGLPLLIICLFAISYKTNTIKIAFIQIVLIAGLVVTHHFSSYMLLLFMIIILIIKTVIKTISHADVKNYRQIRTLTFLTGTLIFAWILHIATIVLTYYQGIFGNAVTGILRLSLFEERVTELLSNQFLDVPFYELFIRRFMYTPLILGLVFIGIYYLYSKKKLFNEYVLALIIFSGLFFVSLLGALTTAFEVGRFSTYGFIGIAFLIGASIERLQKIRPLKIVVLAIIILLLIGGISVGISSPYRGSYSDDIRFGQPTITTDVIYSADWSEKYMGRSNRVISDMVTGSAFDHYGFQRVIIFSAWDVFFPSDINIGVLNHLNFYAIDYLAVDNRVTKYISELRYYFERRELLIKDHPTYGRTEPIPISSIKKFENSTIFLKIYDNGNIGIFNILRDTGTDTNRSTVIDTNRSTVIDTNRSTVIENIEIDKI